MSPLHLKVVFSVGLCGVSALRLQGQVTSTRYDASSRECPKVFVYRLNEGCSDQNPDKYSITNVFGRIVDDASPWVRDTSQYAMGQLFHYRLLNSNCRTMNPEEADLFFVPVLTAPKKYAQIVKGCAECSKETLLDQLPYLNKSNAKKHFLVVSKDHFCAASCSGWWSDPDGLFRQFMRLAHSPILPEHLRDDVKYMKNRNEMEELFKSEKYPNLYALPRPSAVHFTGQIPWTVGSRNTLMLFMGSDSHGDVDVRKKIHHQCVEYNDPSICRWESSKTSRFVDKQEAVFCLEPAGDTPFRRSLTDSMMMGCIPVLFHRATQLTSELIWGEWRDQTHVLVDRDSFLGGQVDLNTLLSSIPYEERVHMQSVLQKNVRKLQVSLEDDPEDLISTVLHGLTRIRK